MKGECVVQKLTSNQAIRKYFEVRGWQPITFDDLRELTPEQRERLGEACARMLAAERVRKPPE
jgi:hypothetical protein